MHVLNQLNQHKLRPAAIVQPDAIADLGMAPYPGILRQGRMSGQHIGAAGIRT